jgi:hypothetical protein
MGLITKGIRALQKGRVQKKLKEAERLDPKGVNLRHVSQDYPSTGTKIRQQAKIQEAQKGAKKAERGTKTEQVAKRVLPKMDKVRTRLQGMSASDIAEEYSGKEITAMLRKIKNPQILAKLQRAKIKREKIAKKFIAQNQGSRQKGFLRQASPTKSLTRVPKSGTPAAELAGRSLKRGGITKRKSGGKMNTDGSSYVASLYKGGKVGG